MQKITPYFWFNNQAEEAINFYMSLFPNSCITNVSRYGEGSPGTPGSVMSANFELAGQEFIALNGGPQFQFNESISLFVNCDSQEEVDRLWNALTDGGEEQPCGWCKDRFGLSWQIVPGELFTLMSDPDPARAQSVMQALFTMKKINLQALRDARANSQPTP